MAICSSSGHISERTKWIRSHPQSHISKLRTVHPHPFSVMIYFSKCDRYGHDSANCWTGDRVRKRKVREGQAGGTGLMCFAIGSAGGEVASSNVGRGGRRLLY